MKVEVIFHTAGQADAIVGEAEGDSWPEMQKELSAVLRALADDIEKRDEDGEADGGTP